ncbi:MAG: bifunctional hydroxymethylpyrimidine kinase/phosphomethylpyrimidine kinase [Gemmatimonadetes bacterium]|nr:bifunctional hydroxymethylpyrimidine kinase/phosphomethylpyrimidine kinase [Gemmatimonadota bacterium]
MPTSKPSPVVALTIAGSDSGGGAGVQADLKTFQAFGIFGTSALTAVTAQNTTGVSGVRALAASDVRRQIDAVVPDLHPAAVKTGMLADAGIVSAVAKSIREHRLRDRFVLDPVSAATSGDRLLSNSAEAALVEELLPLAKVVTPNLHEAALFTGKEVSSLDEMRAAARALVEMGARAALVTGGHLGSTSGGATELHDLLWDGSTELIWSHPRIDGGPFHGTGCTLSAAITAGLALGTPLTEAVGHAIGYVTSSIASTPDLGSGATPLSHKVRIEWRAPRGDRSPSG